MTLLDELRTELSTASTELAAAIDALARADAPSLAAVCALADVERCREFRDNVARLYRGVLELTERAQRRAA